MSEERESEQAGGPLAGVRVVDLSRALAGPYATLMLADAGAEVIKVEQPGVGDNTRHWGPPFVGEEGARQSIYFLSVNRGKRSIELDLSSEKGIEILKALVRRADVLVENFRPGVMDRLGVGPDVLFDVNPALVLLSISGFGEDGPEGGRPGFDQIIQGEAGFMSFTGPVGGPPTKAGVPIGDIIAGMFGAFGVLAALRERETSGKGQHVRTSLLAGMVGVHVFQGARWLIAGEVPAPGGNRHPLIAPYGTFDCADGQMNIAVGSEGQWRTFCDLMQMDADDPLFATNDDRVNNVDALEDRIRKVLAVGTVEEWMERFQEYGIPAGRVRTVDQVYEWDQVKHLGLIDRVNHPQLGELRLPGSPLQYSRSGRPAPTAPPILGADTEQVLADLGWTGGQ